MEKNYASAFFVMLFLTAFSTFAQHKIEGKVVDKSDAPVAFANVILLSAADSTTVYKGAVTSENGNFSLDKIEGTDYLLKISFVGYEDFLKSINVDSDENLGKITLKETAANLEEVTVTAKYPTVERKVDRLVFNVENTVLSSGNAFDILKRTPGVIVSQGQLLIKNQPAVVYINDRKVYLTQTELQQLLEGFSGGHVKSVEVITNPPAKYDAEGGSILNIVMSKNPSIGYKGSVNASNTIAIVPKYSLGISQYYKNDWVNIFANYNFDSKDDYKNDEGKITYFEPDGSVDSYWRNDFERNTETTSHSLNMILDFTLNEKNSLSFSANILHTPKSDSDIDGLTKIYSSEHELDSLFTTNSRLVNNQGNYLLNGTYISQLGENGASLSAIFNYIKYDDEQDQDLQTEYFSPEGNLLNENSFFTKAAQNTDIFTGQLDLSSPWENITMDTGIKYSIIDSESGMDFFGTGSGVPELNSALSDQFDYNENIYAAYFSLAKDWEKWSIKGGIRGEYTDVQGNSVSLGLVNTQEYFKIFPTFYVVHTPNERHSFGIDYSRRITRPRFQSLNPYRYFLNENNFNIGNPNLQPGFINKLNFNYTYKNKLSFDLYWEHSDKATAILPFQDNEDRVLRSVTDNLDFEQQVSLDIMYYDYVKNWWYLYVYSSLFYMQTDFVALESGNQIVTNDVFSTYISMQNFLTLSKDGTFSGEVAASFLPAFIAGSYDFESPQFGLSLGLRKTFFEDRLVASVNVEDVFNTQNVALSSRYLNQDNSFFAKPESRKLRFSLLYKFGNFKLNDNQRAIEAQEEERLKAEELL